MSTEPTVTLPAPDIQSARPPRGKWEREYEAYQRLLPQLLQTHRGQYVAIHDGHVVDSDADDIALILRVHARHGYVPIHVERVSEQPPLPSRIPHYREYRPEGAV
jgi:hypothetical protein